ncbi:response regulator [Cohnella sp. GCM10027633]|uniref:response regulator transcription factor n=1 Tax=unclassified Cohnella TaxID=2636738 RepID=UPI00362B4E54
MYKVMLVDDEPTIREGLRTLIEWESLGYAVADTAANGIEALDKCGKLQPDLIIVDIRMPVMNGLEFVQTLRERGFGMHVIILSGYADFEYAKKAMAYRIDGYLLKPVDEDELIQYLNQLKLDLDMEYEDRRLAKDERSADHETAIVRRLTGEGPESASARPESTRDWESYEIALVKPYELGDNEASAYAGIRRELVARFEGAGRGLVFSIEPYFGLLLKNGIEDEWRRQQTHKDIAAACEAHAEDFAAASGGKVADWDEIGVSYRTALRVMKQRFFHESGRIAGREAEAERDETPNPDCAVDAEAAAEKLVLALDVGNRDAIREQVSETAGHMAACRYGEQPFKSELVQIAAAALDKLSVARPELRSREYRAKLLELYKEHRSGTFVDHLVGILQEIASQVDGSSADKQIVKMIDLIGRNYAENLKLEKLAELFNYNSAYLGKLFKSETGESFNTYLDKVRIEQAKQMLEQGMKVYQVAEKVGYANVDYFHSKFRKYVGISPSAYKRK